MSLYTGGPAFPVGIVSGMTLRDYFAAMALQVVYEKNFNMFMDYTFESPEEAVEGAAKDAYELADAMLQAREKK